MQLSVEQALRNAHSQVLEIIDNHVSADIEDMPSVKETLMLMAFDLQNAAEGLH